MYIQTLTIIYKYKKPSGLTTASLGYEWYGGRTCSSHSMLEVNQK